MMSVMDRFWDKAAVGDWQDCWLWTAATIPKGYGRFSVDGRLVYAHRHAYELLVGPVPEGLDLDHVRSWGCISTSCVNPLHLEPVTRSENLLRGDTGKINNPSTMKTHCPQGHPYDDENTYRYDGRRFCRECGRVRSREWWRTHRGR